MSLWCFRENKHREFCYAGRDGRYPSGARDASGDVDVAWIPAPHAEMTELRSRNEINVGPPGDSLGTAGKPCYGWRTVGHLCRESITTTDCSGCLGPFKTSI
jgi:hypothetical protein